MTEQPCPPVEAFRWLVFVGTSTLEVVAASRDDAKELAAWKANAARWQIKHAIRARRLTVGDEARHAQLAEVADALGIFGSEGGAMTEAVD